MSGIYPSCVCGCVGLHVCVKVDVVCLWMCEVSMYGV